VKTNGNQSLSHAMKKESYGAGATHKNQELRRWSHVDEKSS